MTNLQHAREYFLKACEQHDRGKPERAMSALIIVVKILLELEEQRQTISQK